MIEPTDSADEKNILTKQIETGWPDLLLTFLLARN